MTEFIPISVKSTSKRGGSISINIPSDVAKLMDLKAGDPIVFFYDPENKRIIIEKVSSFSTPTGLSFSLSKELTKKLLKETPSPEAKALKAKLSSLKTKREVDRKFREL